MPKCLIMGGSYFIGKAVIEILKPHMTCYVLNRGTKPIEDKDVIHLKSDRKIESDMKEVLKGITFDYVVDISAYEKTDIEILLNTMDLRELKTYVFISTSAVYDIHQNKPPYKETDTLGSFVPYQTYGLKKIDAEKILLTRLEEKQVVILRPPYVYGPFNYVLRERMMFHLIEHDLPVYVPVSRNYMQFIYVYDLALDILKALEGIIPYGIYNVGNQKSITFYEWITWIEQAMDKKAKLIFVNDDMYHTRSTDYFPFITLDILLDVSLIKSYHPHETDMKKGLEQAYIEYKKVKDQIEIPSKYLDAWQKLSQLLG